MIRTDRKRSRRRLYLILGGLGLVILAAGLAIFQPWLLWVDNDVHDELPTASAGGSSGRQAGTATLISRGTFVSHAHEPAGTASLYRLPDGRYQLALAGLRTTTGPDVRVWMSAGPVVEGKAGWHTAEKHRHLDVAPIKGNRGDQLYNLPKGFDPARWPTVDLWCVRFSVSFGAAALKPVS